MGGVIRVDPSPTAEKEAEDFSNNPEINRKRLSNQQYEQDIAERKKYAQQAFLVTKLWSGALITIVLAQMGLSIGGWGLEKEVFITVIASTTAAMFGFW